jgi:hypothetical protein
MLAILLAAALAGDPVLDAVAETRAWLHLRLATDAPSVPDRAYERAARGDVVVGVDFVDGVAAGRGWGVGVLDAPIEAVWAALNDDESFDGGSIDLSVHLSGHPQRSGRRTFQILHVPLCADRYWVHEVSFNPALYVASGGRAWEMEARVIDGPLPADLAALVDGAVEVPWSRGGWLLRPVDDGRTLAEIWTWADPGGAIPAGLASRFAAAELPAVLRAVERRAHELEAGRAAGFVRPDASAL